jgi:phosphoglycerate dehydrogenase-like enzyme
MAEGRVADIMGETGGLHDSGDVGRDHARRQQPLRMQLLAG